MKTYILAVLVALSAGGAQASSLMLNGEFELGNMNFTSGYGYAEPTGNGVLYPEGL